jgi:adenine-specific DNA glycosylase
MDTRDILDAKVKKAVEQELEEAIPADRPGAFNQAMMEIGACVCIPNGTPKCGECPLAFLCEAHKHGTWEEYPRKKNARSRTVEEKTVLLIRDADRAVICKRENKGLLAGMYEFPTMQGFCTAEEVIYYLEQKGLKTIRIRALEEAKHIFTHKEWHMHGFMIRVDELASEEVDSGGQTMQRSASRHEIREGSDWILIRPEETRDKYPIPSAYAAYSHYLDMRLGKARYEER